MTFEKQNPLIFRSLSQDEWQPRRRDVLVHLDIPRVLRSRLVLLVLRRGRSLVPRVLLLRPAVLSVLRVPL